MRTAEHSVTWDHSECEHEEEDWCHPRATFTCQAPPEALCRNSCQECEDVWWLCGGGGTCDKQRAAQDKYKDEEDDPAPPHPAGRHCTLGHLIMPNHDGECYAVLNLNYGGTGPVDFNDARDQYDGTVDLIVPPKDGPIVVTNQGYEGCTWEYAP